LALESLKGPEGPLQAIRTLSALKAVACHVFDRALVFICWARRKIKQHLKSKIKIKNETKHKKLINKK